MAFNESNFTLASTELCYIFFYSVAFSRFGFGQSTKSSCVLFTALTKWKKCIFSTFTASNLAKLFYIVPMHNCFSFTVSVHSISVFRIRWGILKCDVYWKILVFPQRSKSQTKCNFTIENMMVLWMASLLTAPESSLNLLIKYPAMFFFIIIIVCYDISVCVWKTSCARIQLCDKGMKITNYKANIKKEMESPRRLLWTFFQFYFFRKSCGDGCCRCCCFFPHFSFTRSPVTQQISTYYSPSTPTDRQMFRSVWNTIQVNKHSYHNLNLYYLSLRDKRVINENSCIEKKKNQNEPMKIEIESKGRKIGGKKSDQVHFSVNNFVQFCLQNNDAILYQLGSLNGVCFCRNQNAPNKHLCQRCPNNVSVEINRKKQLNLKRHSLRAKHPLTCRSKCILPTNWHPNSKLLK